MSLRTTNAAYPADRPWPSALLLGFAGERPVHVVLAVEGDGVRWYVVTAYIPDAALWNEDFTRRRP